MHVMTYCNTGLDSCGVVAVGSTSFAELKGCGFF